MAKIRAERNRNAKIGIKNRMRGICKKVNTFNRLYAGEAIVFIRAADGQFSGYQSRPGLNKEFLQDLSDTSFTGPQDFNSNLGSDEPTNYQSSTNTSDASESFGYIQTLSISPSPDRSTPSSPGHTVRKSPQQLALPSGIKYSRPKQPHQNWPARRPIPDSLKQVVETLLEVCFY